MSEQLNHRLLNFEEAPPHAIWEAISQRLDDDNRHAVLSHKLENFETTVPEGAWSVIAERLQDDSKYAAISSKFTSNEITPPAGVWNNIAANLQEPTQQFSSFVSRLQDFEAAPPSNAWNNIVNDLSEEKKTEAQVISLNSYVYKVSAAAVLVGLLIGGWFFINKNNSTVKIDIVKNKPVVNPTIKKQQPVSLPETTINNNQLQDRSVAINQQSAHTIKHAQASVDDKSTATDKHILKHTDVNDLVAYQQKPISIASAPILDNEGNVIRDMDVLTTSNYIMVTGPNGQATRMSSKFANVIRYLNNSGSGTEEYLDRVIIESNTWKKRFQEWRNKISQSSYIPSSSNFLDIVEFKELIQEK